MINFYKGLLWNSKDKNSFAIEPEISANFFEEHIEDFYNDYKNESDYIIELL